ncbi:MAG: 4-hydroxy-3-methylbut-2-enyl diphosphate reductase [Planctomycetaceae bacterium]|nr:4-hydroxy-3-methylbut-2-enyl diphosphate reductase [Planctomycetaceae bacterium]
MRILLATPRGFCAGVNMAIECLEEAIRVFGPDVFVYHEIVHNKSVVDRFTREGVTFVDSVDEVPRGAILLYSAHGISPEIRRQARQRDLRTIDATCPLVTKVHVEAIRYAEQGYHIVLIGHAGHDEVIGTMGEAPQSITLVETPEEVDTLTFAPDAKVACLTQTTLSVQEASDVLARLRLRYPQLETPRKEDICYATTNRQEAVATLAEEADVVIVLGSQNSSNSRRLMEIGLAQGKLAHLVDGAHELRPEWFDAAETVLITAGASAPESVVQECIDYLRRDFSAVVENRVIREESVHFQLPQELRP